MKTIKLKRMIDGEKVIVEINDKHENLMSRIRSKHKSKFLKLWSRSNIEPDNLSYHHSLLRIDSKYLSESLIKNLNTLTL